MLKQEAGKMISKYQMKKKNNSKYKHRKHLKLNQQPFVEIGSWEKERRDELTLVPHEMATKDHLAGANGTRNDGHK